MVPEVSQAGLNRMTRVVARQHAPREVRSHAILPGLTDSPHAAALLSTEKERADPK